MHVIVHARQTVLHVQRSGKNDVDGTCAVAYEILKVASFRCMEQCGSQKKCKMLGAAYPRVNLSSVDGLEHLTWAVYDGVYMPGNPPSLTGHHDWESLNVGTTIHLIYHGRTNVEHCKPSTLASLNAEQATKVTQQQGLLQPVKRRPQATPVAAAWILTIQSVVNVPPQAVSSCSTGGTQAMSQDHKEDSNGESPFHETSRQIMIRSSPVQTAFSQIMQDAFCRFSCSEVCAGLGNGCERFCASRSLLGSYVHRKSI